MKTVSRRISQGLRSVVQNVTAAKSAAVRPTFDLQFAVGIFATKVAAWFYLLEIETYHPLFGLSSLTICFSVPPRSTTTTITLRRRRLTEPRLNTSRSTSNSSNNRREAHRGSNSSTATVNSNNLTTPQKPSTLTIRCTRPSTDRPSTPTPTESSWPTAVLMLR